MKTFFNKLSVLVIVAALLGTIMPHSAFAIAVGSSSHPDSVQAIDGNGNYLRLPDVGYKVFEIMRTTSPTILKDEYGNTPTFGTIVGVWVESASAAVPGFPGQQWGLGFDTTSLTVDQNTAGYRLFPPLSRLTSSTYYPLGAQFTRGFVWVNSDTAAGGWIYWRPNGGRR